MTTKIKSIKKEPSEGMITLALMCFLLIFVGAAIIFRTQEVCNPWIVVGIVFVLSELLFVAAVNLNKDTIDPKNFLFTICYKMFSIVISNILVIGGLIVIFYWEQLMHTLMLILLVISVLLLIAVYFVGNHYIMKKIVK
jgi:hypothetical protein